MHSPILRYCTALTLLSGCLWCQTAPAKNHSVDASAATPKRESPEAKLTPAQERGLRLLKSAEAESAGLEPDMRAFVLWRASYAYTKIDPKKGEKVVADAFTATQAIEDPASDDRCGPIGSAGDIKSWIQQRILSGMVEKQEIAEAEQLLPQATEPVRNQITKQLVQHYAKQKDFTHAEGLLTLLSDSADYPFDAAGDLLVAMGPEMSGDRMTIFNQALNNFEQHSDKRTLGQDDIGNFIERTWTKVPSALVLEAMNKVLEQAKSIESHSHYSMTSASGSVMLNSAYDLRLFQLLPVLEELDKDKAEEFLRDDAEMKARLAKYPQGVQSLSAQGHIYSYGITDSDTPDAAAGVAGDQAQAQVRERMDQIFKEAQKDPAQALADALGLPLQQDLSNSPRALVLVQIAEGWARQKPSLSKSALSEILKIQDQLTPTEMAGLSNLPKIYLDLGDEDGARKALKALLKAAENLYAHDTDAEDPNKAFKGTWPSADLWRKGVQIAAKISPALSEEIIADLSDPDIAAAEKISFASSLLGVSGEPVLVSDCRKNHSGFNFSN